MSIPVAKTSTWVLTQEWGCYSNCLSILILNVYYMPSSRSYLLTCVYHNTGIIAVSCGDSYSFNERIDLSFIQSNFLILIWNFVDPIHPQLFLEAPDTVRCFQFNPSNPNVIVGGCSNGQIVLWNIEDYQDRLQLSKATDPVEPRSMAANLVRIICGCIRIGCITR